MLIYLKWVFALFLFSFTKASQLIPRTSFNDLPAEVLRLIAEYCYGKDSRSVVIPLRFVNRFTFQCFPSIQDLLALKYECTLFKSLPYSKELYHLIHFQHGLIWLVKDSTRYLEKSLPIIMEAAMQKYIDGSLNLNYYWVGQIVKYVLDTRNTQLFVKLIQKNVPVCCSNDNSKDFVFDCLEIVGENEAALINVLESSAPLNNHGMLCMALFLSNLPVEEIVTRTRGLNLKNSNVFIVFLDAIAQSKPTEEKYRKFLVLISYLSDVIDERNWQIVAQMVISLKFDSSNFHLDFFERQKFKLYHIYWTEAFIKVCTQVGRFDVGRIILSSDGYRSTILEKIIAKYPELIDRESRASVLNDEEFMNYRINSEPQDFDLDKDIITGDDVIVSAHIHQSDKFITVVDRMPSEDLKGWIKVLKTLYSNVSLIDKLRMLPRCSTYPKKTRTLHHWVRGFSYIETNFSVLREILLGFDEFVTLFVWHNPYLITVPPEAMAQVLRDDELYGILKRKKEILFRLLHFPYYNAHKILTTFDWERLLALSNIPLKLNDRKCQQYTFMSSKMYSQIERVKESFANMFCEFLNFSEYYRIDFLK